MAEQICTSERQQTETKGTVVGVEGNTVLVKLHSGGCGRCHEPGGCGGQSLTQMMSSEKRYRVPNTIAAQVGDPVLILIDSTLVRRAAWQAYGLPLLLCISGALLGQWLAGDLAALIGAGLGLFGAWLKLRAHRLDAGNSEKQPQLTIQFDRS